MTLRILSSLSAFSVTLAIAGTLMLASGAPAAETSPTVDTAKVTPPALERPRAAQVAVTLSPSAVLASRQVAAVRPTGAPTASNERDVAVSLDPSTALPLPAADEVAPIADAPAGGLNARGATVWIPRVLS